MNGESSMETYTLLYVKWIVGICYVAQEALWVLCDNVEGWDAVGGGWEIQEEGIYMHLWQIHVDVWQKPARCCKAISPQLKIKKKKIPHATWSSQKKKNKKNTFVLFESQVIPLYEEAKKNPGFVGRDYIHK